MLSVLRNLANNSIAKLLIVTLLLIFVGLGVFDSFKHGKQHILTVGDKKFNETEFYNLYMNQVALIQQQTGYTFNKTELNNIDVKQYISASIINQLVNEKLAKDLFISSDEMVKFEIATMPIFFKNGRFDKQTLTDYLAKSQLSENLLVNMVRNDISAKNLDIALSVMNYSPKILSDIISDIQAQVRTLKIINVPKSSVASNYTYNEDDLKKIYHENLNLFSTPEVRNASIVNLETNLSNKIYEFTDQDLLDIYNAQKLAFVIPEKRHVMQFIFSDKDLAHEVHNKLLHNESFKNLAKITYEKNYSDLGKISYEYFSEDISKVIFNLPQGMYSEVVQTPLGFHIFYIDKIINEHTKSFNDVKSSIINNYQNEKRLLALNELTQNINKDIVSGMRFDEITKTYNLKIENLKLVNKQFKEPKDIFEQKSFIDKAFANDLDSIEIFTLNAGSKKLHYLFKIDSITNAQNIDFNIVKPELIKLFNNEKIDSELKKFAENVFEELKIGNTDDVLKAKNLKFTVKNLNIKQAQDSTDISKYIQEIFSIKKGSFTRPINLGKEGNDYIIVFVSDIIDKHDNDSDNAAYKMITDDYFKELKQQLLQRYKEGNNINIDYQLLRNLQF